MNYSKIKTAALYKITNLFSERSWSFVYIIGYYILKVNIEY